MVLNKAIFIFLDTLHEVYFSFRNVLHRLSLVGFEVAETACQDMANIWFGKMVEKHIELQFNSGHSRVPRCSSC